MAGFRSRSPAFRRVALLGLAVLCGTASAQPAVQINDFGNVGLIKTPTARSMGSGTMALGYTRASPLEQFTLHVQPLDWLQGSFRYINITNPVLATDPSRGHFTDKVVDMQLRLVQESAFLPEISVGLMDIGGNALFASEYIVASRRFYNFDVHLGMGWGRLGSRGDFSNPLGSISSRFDERQFDPERPAGQLNPEQYFSGDTALFGGVVWSPRGGPFTLMVELDGNDYENERFGEDPTVPPDAPPEERFPFSPGAKSRLNYGIAYRYDDWVDITASWQRGDTFGISFSAHADFDTLRGPEKSLRPPALGVPAVASMLPSHARALDAPAATRMARDLESQWIYVHAVDTASDNGSEVLTVWASQKLSDNMPLVAGRVARSAIRQTGHYYDTVAVVEVVGGIEAERIEVPVEAFHLAANGEISAEELVELVRLAPTRRGGFARAAYRGFQRYPAFSYRVQPSLRSSIGGPEKFAVTQLLLNVSGTLQFTPRWSATGTVSGNIADNFGDRLDADFPSELPRVRSDIRRFMREGKDVYLSRLETNYIFPIREDLFGRVSGGIFEGMYGGVSSEVLYRPTGARWAVGADIAHVWLREFRQRFGFQDFNTTTGHLTYYHELPYQNLRLMLSAGYYLARDYGTTIDLSRRFRNGARFGVFATFTNVSSETFGEGSFDKGFYISIPFSLFSAEGGSGDTLFSFRMLQRDGGQKVTAGRPLYEDFDRSRAQHGDLTARDWLQ